MVDNQPPSGIDAANYPELRKWVVGSLSGHRKPNDIIFQLCQRTGWEWNRSKSFVEQVVQIDQKAVHQRRLPLLVALGVFMVAGGVLLFLPALFDMINLLSRIEPPLDLDKILFITLQARVGFLTSLRLITGMGMIVGGGWGIGVAIRSAITGEGEDLMKSGTHR